MVQSSGSTFGRVVRSAGPAGVAGQRESASASASYSHSTSFLSAIKKNLNLALIVLNIDHHRQGSVPELGNRAAARFRHAWDQSSMRICADGAANRLHDSLTSSEREFMLPDLITGDLDSLRDDVAQYYGDRGVSIQRDPAQDSHDFEKCLRWLERREVDEVAVAAAAAAGGGDGGGDGVGLGGVVRSSDVGSAAAAPAANPPPPKGQQQQQRQQEQQQKRVLAAAAATGQRRRRRRHRAPMSVVAFGAFGGRLDQQMANLNMAYYSFGGAFESLYLVSDDSLAFVLAPGVHTIEINPDEEDGTCGLVPLGGACQRVVTSGLRWDLAGDVPLEFGGLISSSNEFARPTITVETDAPLLWTTGLRRG